MCVTCEYALVGNLEAVQKAFDAKNPLPNYDICPAVLHHAVRSGNKQLVIYLIEDEQRGGSINDPFLTHSHTPTILSNRDYFGRIGNYGTVYPNAFALTSRGSDIWNYLQGYLAKYPNGHDAAFVNKTKYSKRAIAERTQQGAINEARYRQGQALKAQAEAAAQRAREEAAAKLAAEQRIRDEAKAEILREMDAKLQTLQKKYDRDLEAISKKYADEKVQAKIRHAGIVDRYKHKIHNLTSQHEALEQQLSDTTNRLTLASAHIEDLELNLGQKTALCIAMESDIAALKSQQRTQEEYHRNELEELENRFEEKLRIDHLTVRLKPKHLYDILNEFRKNPKNPVIRKFVQDSIVEGIEHKNPCRTSELENLSFIALPNDDVINTRQEELRDHGAILAVSDLAQKIQKTGKPDARLQKAAEDLLALFMQNKLPGNVSNDLQQLVKTDEIYEKYEREKNSLVFEAVELFLSGKLLNAKLYEQAFYAAINTLPDRDHYTNTYKNLLSSVMNRDSERSNSTKRDLNKLASRVQQVMADQLYRQHSELWAYAAVQEIGNYVDNRPRNIKDHIHETIKSALEDLRDQMAQTEQCSLRRFATLNHTLYFSPSVMNPKNPQFPGDLEGAEGWRPVAGFSG